MKSKHHRQARRVALVVALVSIPIAALAGALGAREPDDTAAEGIAAFLLGDFGGVTLATLNTNALPYKVVATALLMRAERLHDVRLGRGDLPTVYREFGFITPDRIGNWPASQPQPRLTRPIGMVSRELVPTPLLPVRVDVANLGCTTCHAGLLHDSVGRVTQTAWVGTPNSSINLEAYSQAVFVALGNAMRDQAAFRARVGELFPEMGVRERFALRYVIVPRVSRRIRALQRANAGVAPYSNGGSGRTNGVASLKHMLGVPPGIVSGHPDVGFTSIPELAGRGFRTSLLYDGVYAPIGAERFEQVMDSSRVTNAHLDSLGAIVAFFTVSTMGVQPDVGERAIPAMNPVLRWLGRSYRSPPFPGAIDSALMRDGARVFGSKCAKCHGTYGEGRPRPLLTYPNAHVMQTDLGTDSSRWAMVDSIVLGALASSAYQRHMTPARTGGYVAPILSGIWATAPYLHNGSVPTLWALLDPPVRPTRFLVGGHELDYRTMGIAGVAWSDSVVRYRPGYVPWAMPELYDTRLPGLSNGGHVRQLTGITAQEKWAVIEYLKTL